MKKFKFAKPGFIKKALEDKRVAEKFLKGLEKNEFKMYLQFVVDNKSEKIISAEALSRWDRGEKGIISPDKYIGNMEKVGVISQHDFYMFDIACKQLEKWKDTENKNVSISCNFTRITISKKTLLKKFPV